MFVFAAIAVTVLGTISGSFRRAISGFAFWTCVAITAITIYGMFLP
jgi:hypothetical protein